jgi:hypothetical protein
MMRAVVFREVYPDGLRDWLACGHVVYTTSLREVERRRCLLCTRHERKPAHERRKRPS